MIQSKLYAPTFESDNVGNLDVADDDGGVIAMMMARACCGLFVVNEEFASQWIVLFCYTRISLAVEAAVDFVAGGIDCLPFCVCCRTRVCMSVLSWHNIYNEII